MMMQRALMLTTLLVAVSVTAVSAEPSTGVRSVYEPGSLGMGELGVRVGFSVADGPPGPGAELFLGLGRVDVSLGASAIPVTIFGETDTHAFVSMAGQALIHEWGGTRLSVRAMLADEVSEPSRVHTTSELRLTTGSARRRLLVGGVTTFARNGNDEWDTAFIGHAGVELLSRNSIGITLLAVLIAEKDDLTPFASVNATFQ